MLVPVRTSVDFCVGVTSKTMNCINWKFLRQSKRACKKGVRLNKYVIYRREGRIDKNFAYPVLDTARAHVIEGTVFLYTDRPRHIYLPYFNSLSISIFYLSLSNVQITHSNVQITSPNIQWYCTIQNWFFNRFGETVETARHHNVLINYCSFNWRITTSK